MTDVDDLIKRLRNDVGEWNDREMGHPDEWDRHGKDVFALAMEAADALQRMKEALAMVPEAESLLRSAAMELRKGQALPKDERTDLAHKMIDYANELEAARAALSSKGE